MPLNDPTWERAHRHPRRPGRAPRRDRALLPGLQGPRAQGIDRDARLRQPQRGRAGDRGVAASGGLGRRRGRIAGPRARRPEPASSAAVASTDPTSTSANPIPIPAVNGSLEDRHAEQRRDGGVDVGDHRRAHRARPRRSARRRGRTRSPCRRRASVATEASTRPDGHVDGAAGERRPARSRARRASARPRSRRGSAGRRASARARSARPRSRSRRRRPRARATDARAADVERRRSPRRPPSPSSSPTSRRPPSRSSSPRDGRDRRAPISGTAASSRPVSELVSVLLGASRAGARGARSRSPRRRRAGASAAPEPRSSPRRGGDRQQQERRDRGAPEDERRRRQLAHGDADQQIRDPPDHAHRPEEQPSASRHRRGLPEPP